MIAMPPEITEANILAALAELGETPEAIAATLQSRGIVGMPGDDNQCALARAMDAYFARPSFAVAERGPWVIANDQIDLEVELPKPYAEFVKRFDDREFPALVERGSDAWNEEEDDLLDFYDDEGDDFD